MKQKTKKAAAKRFYITGSGKVKRRAVKQSHFNAKASGNETRKKHVDKTISDADHGKIKDLIPHG